MGLVGPARPERPPHSYRAHARTREGLPDGGYPPPIPDHDGGAWAGGLAGTLDPEPRVRISRS